MLKRRVLWIVLTLCSVQGWSPSSHNPDEVTDLPGLHFKPNFKHYSGYLSASGTKKLHYWFVESQNNPAKDPLLLWLNGGPGCSSLDGFLSELGPFWVKSDGATLTVNPYSWNTIANVIFLESPAGVGFSFSDDKKYATDDDKVSMDNYLALQDFFKKYPQFVKNDFYITGESYGGIYVPTLAVRVANGSFHMNLKGFAVGNGVTSFQYLRQSLVYFAYYHGLFGDKLWSDLIDDCCEGPGDYNCDFVSGKNPDCESDVRQVRDVLYNSGLNVYSLYSDCITGTTPQLQRFLFDMKNLYPDYTPNLEAVMKPLSINWEKPGEPLKSDVPCINSSAVTAWLNSRDVRRALHIPEKVPDWEICSSEVGSKYKRVYTTMREQYHTLLLSKIRGLVYNGDTDMACNFLGDQWFVESLKLPVKKDRAEWRFNSQVAGFVKRFRGLDFVTVKGAGHMVPQFKPGPSLKMISKWLFNGEY